MQHLCLTRREELYRRTAVDLGIGSVIVGLLRTFGNDLNAVTVCNAVKTHGVV